MSSLVKGHLFYKTHSNSDLTTHTHTHTHTHTQSIGEFVLTHPDIRIPPRGKIFSINEGYAQYWDEPVTEYVHQCKFPKDGKAPMAARYGSTITPLAYVVDLVPLFVIVKLCVNCGCILGRVHT